MNIQMLKSNVTIGKKATNGLMRGVKLATDAIRPSYGPKGVNAVIEESLYPYHRIVNDAHTIIQAIQTDNILEKRGLAFVKELSDKAEKDSGDGRKTTIIIAEEILKGGLKSTLSPMELKRELNALIPLIEKNLNEQKKTITEKEVEAVASIAGESKEIGKTLGAIYKKIGKEGIIHLENSNTYTDSTEFIEGVRFAGTGYLSPYLVHDEVAKKAGQKETKAIYEKPAILVTKRRISSLKEINPLLRALEDRGEKDLVIFTDDMDSQVASTLIDAHKQHVVNILIIPCPIIWKHYIFEDFAKVTGATIVEEASGVNFKNLQLSHLGTCDRIVTNREETIITGGADISSHIAELKARGDTDSLLRLSWLTTKTCILKLGANNETELSHYRLKMADAINSSKLALKDGVVRGGGLALVEVGLKLPKTKVGDIVESALMAPYLQLVKNNGTEFEVGNDIVDAAAVVKNAVRNAISLASIVLTSGIVIHLPPKTAEQIAGEVLERKGIRI